MRKTDLTGTWRMTGGGYDCQGAVPGTACSFLLTAGAMPDPFYRDNELRYQELLDNDFTFSRTFTYQPGGSRCFLHFDGLDTVCRVKLNGELVADTCNMHRTYEWDVTELLHCGENMLEVTCFSAFEYLRKKQAERLLRISSDTLPGYPHIRKAYYMLGWDWGPILLDMGIWRSVYLLEVDGARLEDLRILQRHEAGRVFVTAIVDVTDGVTATSLMLTTPEGVTIPLENGRELEIDNPQFWWPNGMGEQPLYAVTARLEDQTISERIGLRTIELVRERDRYGESFFHRVNGVDMFAMGADYIPEDSIIARTTAERTRYLLHQARDCHFNTIRVWGGGYYPEDWFYDICDELGLLVYDIR